MVTTSLPKREQDQVVQHSVQRYEISKSYILKPKGMNPKALKYVKPYSPKPESPVFNFSG